MYSKRFATLILIMLFLHTAMPGSDYDQILFMELEFPVGSTNQAIACANIVIIQDNMVEGEETFFLQLRPATTGVHLFFATDITTITIIDGESM